MVVVVRLVGWLFMCVCRGGVCVVVMCEGFFGCVCV